MKSAQRWLDKKLLRDAASLASLLREFAEHFSDGELPKDLWARVSGVCPDVSFSQKILVAT
jgi:hypothetical protein